MMKKMIKNKEYTSVDCFWLYAYVKVRISPVSICPGEHLSAHRVVPSVRAGDHTAATAKHCHWLKIEYLRATDIQCKSW